MADRPSLAQRLTQYTRTPAVPFHMPGHKRRPLHTPDLPWAMDITEIDGFDDLHHPQGVLADAMAAAAALWGSEEARFLVNGSTGGILATLHAVCPRGSTLLVARNCHKSVYHAMELLDIRPIYLQPPTDSATGLAGSLSPATLAAALADHPQAVGLFLTSPTYDGVLSDISALAALCHGHGIPLLVDEAHGAHLGFGSFPPGGVAGGGDVVIHSLHKTLPSLTQTAILHRQGPLIDSAKLARSLNIFQTSSPSYPLMASLDGCVALMAAEGHRMAQDWLSALAAFDGAIDHLQHLGVLCHGADRMPQHPAFWGFDPSKLVIFTGHAALTGPQLMERLRREFDLELEMAGPNYATAMTGLGDSTESLSALAKALRAIDGACPAGDGAVFPLLPPLPQRQLMAGQALELPWETLPWGEAVHRVAADYLWAYPPGIPLVVPGEVFSPALLAHLAALEAAGVSLLTTGGGPLGNIRVCLGETP